MQSLSDAPAGGKYLRINGKDHYITPGAEVTVKPGEEVEAGDIVSSGMPNPAKIVEHKGIGEGRRYFVDAFRKALAANNITAHRRNLEVLARGLIGHVRLTAEMGDHNPEDIVGYDELERSWQPRPGHRVSAPNSALGKYLEKPVLHYSIGTQIRKSMIPTLKEFGVNQITVHAEPPPFQPEMIRGMDNLQHDPDWLTRQLGSNLKKSFLKGVHTAAVSDPMGTSYVPALADPVNYGRQGLVRGFELPKSRPGKSVLDGIGG